MAPSRDGDGNIGPDQWGIGLPRFEVAVDFDGDMVVVRMAGRLTIETTSVLETVMNTLVDVVETVVFDFAGLHTVDDFGVDALEGVMKRGCAAGWRIGVRNTRRDPKDIADRYGLHEIADAYTLA